MSRTESQFWLLLGVGIAVTLFPLWAQMILVGCALWAFNWTLRDA